MIKSVVVVITTTTQELTI